MKKETKTLHEIFELDKMDLNEIKHEMDEIEFGQLFDESEWNLYKVPIYEDELLEERLFWK